MKPAKGPRPWTIRLFAALFVAQALLSFAKDMNGRLDLQASIVASSGLTLDDDHLIVLLCARLTIAFIPVALIWCFASNFARWLATIIAVGKLVNTPSALDTIASGQQISLPWIGSITMSLAAVSLLFAPSARRWFADKGMRRADAFE